MWVSAKLLRIETLCLAAGWGVGSHGRKQQSFLLSLLRASAAAAAFSASARKACGTEQSVYFRELAASSSLSRPCM